MVRLAVRPVEALRVREKCSQARFGAEVDGPAAVCRPRNVLRVGIMEDPAAQGDEVRRSNLQPARLCGHLPILIADCDRKTVLWKPVTFH